jgi:hypothetical protein
MIFVRSKKPPFRTLAMSGSEVFLSLRLPTDQCCSKKMKDLVISEGENSSRLEIEAFLLDRKKSRRTSNRRRIFQ